MVHGSMEIVHEGLLKKSPPPKRLWRAKWRMRWFVLRSGELPGQYFLEYYTDRTCRKLKGKIDLDQCDQVDAGITFPNRKAEYKYMFDIKTPKRIYYLCAETEQEMNRWVDCVCQVCGLKMYSQEDEYPITSLEHLNVVPNVLPATPPAPLHALTQDHHSQLDSPSLSPSSISGPYIPISECITGKRTPITGSSFPFSDDVPLPPPGSTESHRSSIPNEMAPPAPVMCPDNQPTPNLTSNINTGAIPREAYDMQRQFRPSGTTSEDTLSVQSPLGTEGSSVFSEDEWALTPPKVEVKFFSDGARGGGGGVPHSHRDTLTKEGQWDGPAGALGGGSSTLSNDMRGLSISDDPQVTTVTSGLAPPRPPKPAHLIEVPQQTYQNIESLVKSSVVRRNSSNDKVKNGTGFVLSPHETIVGVSDPEPSPASVGSSVPPSTPSELAEDMQALVARSQQQLGDGMSVQLSDRSKVRICQNSLTPAPVQSQFFSYDVQSHDSHEKPGESDPRISPAGLYSNIPQTNVSPIHPPAINRGLKPRKGTDGGNLSASEMSPPPSGGGGAPKDVLGAVGGSPIPPTSAPPAIDRNLKPMKNHADSPVIKSIVLDPAPLRYKKHHDQRIRAAPSPTPPTLGNGRCNNESGDEPERTSNPNSRRNSTQDEQIFFPLPIRAQHEIQYTDLDLDLETRHSPKPLKSCTLKNSAISSAPSVVYKTIDFVKTEVFNEMKKNVEDTYRKNQ